MLMDESGSLKIEGWQADWGPQYEMLEPGNRVVITNIGIDGWAALDREKCTEHHVSTYSTITAG